MDLLRSTLKRHEGYRDRVYLDSEGLPTVGYGHHLYVGSRINEDIAERLLEIDIADAVEEFLKLPIQYIRNLNPARRRVVVNMLFNMGLQKVLGFKKMWSAIEGEDWEEASRQLLDSKYAVQVGKAPPSERFPRGQRAWELAQIIRSGCDL